MTLQVVDITHVVKAALEDRAKQLERLRALHRRYEQLDAAETAVWKETEEPVWWTMLLETVIESEFVHESPVLRMYVKLFENVLKGIGIKVPEE